MKRDPLRDAAQQEPIESGQATSAQHDDISMSRMLQDRRRRRTPFNDDLAGELRGSEKVLGFHGHSFSLLLEPSDFRANVRLVPDHDRLHHERSFERRQIERMDGYDFRQRH